MVDPIYQTWVCVGRDALTSGKLGIGFDNVINGVRTSEPTMWYTASKVQAAIGHIYQVELNAAGQLLTQSLKYQGQWPNKQEVIDWQAHTQAILLKLKSQKLQKQAERQNLVQECLHPLTRQYRRMTSQERIAFEVQILTYLRNTTFGSW